MRDLTDNEMSGYVQAWKRRREQRARNTRTRIDAAWKECKRLSVLLKQEYGATEVRVFGSLIHSVQSPEAFREDSDIDLAARGIPADRFFSACGRLMMESKFPVDLVDLDGCPQRLKETISREAVVLDS